MVYGLMGTQRVKNPILEELVYTLRDPETSLGDYWSATEKLGEYMGVLLSSSYPTKIVTVKTLMDREASHEVIAGPPTIIGVLGAAVPFVNGFKRVFKESPVGYFGVERDHETLQPNFSYLRLTDLTDKHVLIVDPMLATAGTTLGSIEYVKQFKPAGIKIAAIIASEDGIKRVEDAYPQYHLPLVQVYAAAVDPELNEKGYILPGLGDAGDRGLGKKVNVSLKK